MTLDQVTIELKAKLACQYEEINLLKEKLITFDEISAQKNDLQSQICSLKQWMEDIKVDDESMRKTLLNNLETQTQKLRKVESDECKARAEIKRLGEINELLNEKIRTLEENEQNLKCEKNDLEVCKNRALDELFNAKNRLKELECIVESMSKSLKCKEEEYCRLRCDYDTCRSECERLAEACKNLAMDLETAKSDLESVECQAKQAEERLRCENETLSNELEAKCQKLRIIEIEYNEARRIIANDKCNIQKLEQLIVKLREAAEKDQCEMNMKIQKLKKEICIKDELASRMKCQIADLQRHNECMVADIKLLKKQIRANECLLEKMKHSNAAIEQIRNNKYEQLEREKNCLANDVKCQQRKIVDLEHQTCCLQEKVKEQELNKCRTLCDPCPPCDPCGPYPPCGNPCATPCPPPCPTPCPPPCSLPCAPCGPCTPCVKPIKLCKTNTCEEKNMIDELKQLYCDLEEIRKNYKVYGSKKECN